MQWPEQKFVTRTIELNAPQNGDTSDYQYIAYGTDGNFMMGCAVSIASVMQQNPQGKFVFNIFTNAVSEDYQQKFLALAKEFNSIVIIHLLNAESLSHLPTNKLWSSAIYYRFLIADFFAGLVNKVLYLDSDIVCNNDISSLWDIDLTDKLCAAAPERTKDWWTSRADTLHCPVLKDGYFNSGVMLIEVQNWAANSITQKAMAALAEPEIVARLTYYDQDILNLICAGEVYFLEQKYNEQYSINYELQGRHKNPINSASVFIHYIGPTKPWHRWVSYPCCNYFLKAKNNSPWGDDDLLAPSNPSQWRYAAKHFYKQGHYLQVLQSYIRYFLLKIL
ncbi:LPS 1,3-galactosyltransferase [Salmonella enterica subsp. enterica serovar Choleraesuis]|nr:LPS 1,3-galactosyltransferase [Salmonella enterica subsp. enterica serovar Choleraesuis]